VGYDYVFLFAVLTTAQVRPMVFPHLQGTSTPDSAVSNTEIVQAPPPEEKPVVPPPQLSPEKEGNSAHLSGKYPVSILISVRSVLMDNQNFTGWGGGGHNFVDNK
jgi:hypothetical protein